MDWHNITSPSLFISLRFLAVGIARCQVKFAIRSYIRTFVVKDILLFRFAVCISRLSGIGAVALWQITWDRED
jgi:hypothetical protein